MDAKQYAALTEDNPDAQVIWAHSIYGPDRTLLLGYTVDRHSWHVYLKDRMIHVYVYTGGVHPTSVSYFSQEKIHAPDMVPDKRTYPESTDYAVAQRLRQLMVPVVYTKFDDSRYWRMRQRVFHGEVIA